MANGADRIFSVLKNTAEEVNNTNSQYVTLEITSLNPLEFKLGDKLVITSEFYVLGHNFDLDSLSVGSKVNAFVLNNSQLFYIIGNCSFTGIVDNLNSTATDKALSANQGRVLNNKFSEYLPLTGGTLTGNFQVDGIAYGFLQDHGNVPDNDFNKALINGKYKFTNVSILNSPVSGKIFGILIVYESNSWIFQNLMLTDGRVWKRRLLDSSTTTSWEKESDIEILENTDNTIPSNSDLNNYTTPGVYRCANVTIAGTLTNSPVTNVGFKLIVECTSGSARYRQTIYANRITGDLTYVRHNNGSWGNWYKYTMTQV